MKKSRKVYVKPFDYYESYVNENSDCILIETYFKNKTRYLKLKCICGEEYEMSNGSFRRSSVKKCKVCTKKHKIETLRNNHEDISLELKNYNLELISKYKDTRYPIDLKCSCGSMFSTSLDAIRQSNHKSCPKCVSKFLVQKFTKTHVEFLKEFSSIDNFEEYTIVESYSGHTTKIKIKHLKCNKYFYSDPSHLLRGQLCPYCRESKGEKRVSKIMNSLNIEYITQYKFKDCKNVLPLPFDFYIPEYNMLIEYDGVQHFKPVKLFGGLEGYIKRKKNDLIKNKFCRENDIKLIRIPYTDYDTINKNLTYLFKI